MKLDWSHWIYTLLKTVIGGVAGAGSAWLGTLVGSQINSDIHALDLRQMGFVLLSSTLLNLFFFLKQSPLPEDHDKGNGIAEKLTLLLVAGLLSFGAMPALTGCSTVPQTREAIVYKSFRTTWAVTLAAHDAYCERAVLGKVKPEDMVKVDAAWNKFRAVFKVTFAVSQRDWTMPAPATLDAAEKELLNLIRTL